MIGLVTFSPRRRIGSLSIECAIEEQHTDNLVVTDHPVERSAPISDHAYMQPASLTVLYGWSNSSLKAGFNPDYIRQVYDELRSLQSAREPLDIVTGKRSYKDMVITSLATTTDEKTASILMITATLREVIRVETRVVSVPPASVQSSPQATAATTNAGVAQPRPSTLSPGG